MGDQIYVHWSKNTVVLSCGFHAVLETEDDSRRNAFRQLEYVLVVDLEYDATVDSFRRSFPGRGLGVPPFSGGIPEKGRG